MVEKRPEIPDSGSTFKPVEGGFLLTDNAKHILANTDGAKKEPSPVVQRTSADAVRELSLQRDPRPDRENSKPLPGRGTYIRRRIVASVAAAGLLGLIGTATARAAGWWPFSQEKDPAQVSASLQPQERPKAVDIVNNILVKEFAKNYGQKVNTILTENMAHPAESALHEGNAAFTANVPVKPAGEDHPEYSFYLDTAKTGAETADINKVSEVGVSFTTMDEPDRPGIRQVVTGFEIAINNGGDWSITVKSREKDKLVVKKYSTSAKVSEEPEKFAGDGIYPLTPQLFPRLVINGNEFLETAKLGQPPTKNIDPER